MVDGFGLAFVFIFGVILLLMVVVGGISVIRIIRDSRSADVEEVKDDFLLRGGDSQANSSEGQTRVEAADTSEDENELDADEFEIDDVLKK